MLIILCVHILHVFIWVIYYFCVFKYLCGINKETHDQKRPVLLSTVIMIL